MIRAEVRTVLEFKTEEDFRRYLKCDQEAIITGFANELREAFKTGKPFEFTTPRPEYGEVVTSYITASRVES